jgi:hypothetical protein
VALALGPTKSPAADERDLPFYALACEHDPGIVRADRAPFPPAGCRGLNVIQLGLGTTVDGIPSACMTDVSGWCRMRAELGRVMVLSVEPFIFPTGYVPQANPLVVRVSEAGQGIVFVRPEALVEGGGTARMTVHSRFCPEQYDGDDWYNDCHDTPPAYREAITLIGTTLRGAWTDESGNTGFDALPAGTWTIMPARPERTLRTYAFCSRTGESGVPFPIVADSAPLDPATAAVHLTLQAGDDILCDVYTVPAPPPEPTAQITFHMRLCGEIAPPDQIFAACHDNGISDGWIDVFEERSGSLVYQGHLDEDGNITVRVSPGRFSGQTVPGHYVRGEYIYCSQDGKPETGIEEFPTVAAGEAWTCDVYVSTETFR